MIYERDSKKPIYVSTSVFRALWLLAKLPVAQKSVSEEARTLTPDEIADNFLRQIINDQYPQILEHQKAVNKLEQALLKSL